MNKTRGISWICSSCQIQRQGLRANGTQIRAFSRSRAQQQAVRPPNAPRQTPNINNIRRNKEAYEDNCLKRRYLERAEEARSFDKEYDRVGELRQQVQEPKKSLRAIENKIGSLSAQKTETSQAELQELKKRAQVLKEESDLSTKEALLAEAEQRLSDIALGQPSLTSPETPIDNAQDKAGKLTSEAQPIEYLNYIPGSKEAEALKQPRKSHTDIGSDLSLLDFASASTTSGWGWYYLKSQAALLEQALIQYALSILVKRGWTIVSPPSIVYSYIAEACGFQPRDQNDEQQIYELSQSARDDSLRKPSRSLAATAEIPLAAMLADQTILSSQLPLKVAGVSRCYRAEAGARGVESKGLYRVHEFNKVEMFAWTDSPSSSDGVDPLTSPSQWTQYSQPLFEEMVSIQKEILTSLNLPCRVLEMPISDLGASAYRKIDIEAFFPSRYRPRQGSSSEEDKDNGWGELTSTSICTDYQSRRLGTRVKDPNSKSTRFAHTVNGTAMAVPRVLAALMEYNYHPPAKGEEGKGELVIPEVLRKYMPGNE